MRLFFAILLGGAAAFAQQTCDCDPAHTAKMSVRNCSLCNEAEKATGDVFFLKDISPRKPNRWLALPKRHADGQHHLHEFSKAERTALWAAAMARAKELWGDEWGVAYNGPKVRTQCHTHVHIGKLLKGVERDVNVITVSRPDQIPAPENEGVWIHPVGTRIHVHLGEQTTETALMR
jgi:diadenosine tetraphosphate (Ap4A) HIT family hydrolase